MKKGKISVKADSILPIIKKWLYSDKDIFLREVISNASDAIFKFERLSAIGEAEKNDNEEFNITVSFDKDKSLLTISDNGIGMTEEEVKQYIAQVAFSGAIDFIEKYKESEDRNGIIGHFGLGFYSVFMVSDLVEIDTLSYAPNAQPVKWICDGSSTYQIGAGERTSRGTTLTLHITDESRDLLDASKLRQIIKKYCSFISYEIHLSDENKEIKEEDTQKVKAVNTHPLWLKKPKDCTDEEYKQFYQDVFNDYTEPLFWIHINVDSPFQLKAIIYFPKIREDVHLMDLGEIKLYYNQVFVADNIKEILPEFLMVLKGVIDCPDIPINVSRSFLQNDSSVKKISNLIAKKISDKLHNIFTNNRAQYNKDWDDIQLLIKYGCIRDNKFFDRMKDTIIFKTIDEEYLTLSEYLDKKEDKKNKTVYYTDNKVQQSSNIQLYKQNNITVVEFCHPIDSRFLQELEMKEQGVQFICVTSELPDTFVSEQITDEKDVKALTDIFKAALSKDKMKVKVEYFKDEKIPAILTLSEQTKRYAQMNKSFKWMSSGMDADNFDMIINRNNPLIQKILDMQYDADKEKRNMLCRQIYDIGLLSHREFHKNEKELFVERSYKLFEMIS